MSAESVRALIETKVLTLTPTAVFDAGLLRSRKVAVGATEANVVSIPVGYGGSDMSTRYLAVQVVTTVVHTLASPIDESAYREGAFTTDLASLLDPEFYQVAGVYEVSDDSQAALDEPSRVGNVLEYAVVSPTLLITL